MGIKRLPRTHVYWASDRSIIEQKGFNADNFMPVYKRAATLKSDAPSQSDAVEIN